MIKKLRSNKGSTMVTAIAIMIVVATLGIITTLILSSSVRISMNRVTDRLETIKIENQVYDCLNYVASEFTEIGTITVKLNEMFETANAYGTDTKYTVFITTITDEDAKQVRVVSEDGFEFKCSVIFDFTNDKYKITEWGE